MNVKNIAKIVSTILVTLIFYSLVVHFNSETGSQLPLLFDGAPVQLVSLLVAFPGQGFVCRYGHGKSWKSHRILMDH